MKKYNEQILSPVAFYGIGLLPIMMVCTSALNALKFGAILFVAVVLCNLLYLAFKPIVNDNVRIPCYVLLVIGVEYLIDSVLSEFTIGSYSSVTNLVSYLFVATIIIYLFETSSKVKTASESLLDGIMVCGEYALCMVVIGLVREILGFGTLFGANLFGSGIPLFAGQIGALLLICVYAVVYNILTASLKKRRKTYYSLVDRYGMFLDSKYLELQPLKSSEYLNYAEDGGSETVKNDVSQLEENAKEEVN